MHSGKPKIEAMCRYTSARGAPIESFRNDVSVNVTGTNENSVKFIFMKFEEAEFRADLGHFRKRKQRVEQKTGRDESAQTCDYVEDGPNGMRVTDTVAARFFGSW